MHSSPHGHRHRRAAASLAVVATGLLLGTAAAGPALASARHSHAHRPATHAPGKHPSHPPARPAVHVTAPPASAGWADYYISRKVKNTSQHVLYELAVRRQAGGSLSLGVFRLGSGVSAARGSETIKPGWILVLPAGASQAGAARTQATRPAAPPSAAHGWARYYTVPLGRQVLSELAVKRLGNTDFGLNVFRLSGESGHVVQPDWMLALPATGGTPAAPTGPLATAAQSSGGPAVSTGGPAKPATQPASASGAAGAAKPAAPTTSRLAGVGAVVLIILLLVLGLLARRRRGQQRTGRTGPPRRPHLSLRPPRGKRPGRPATPTAAAPAGPALASDTGWEVSGARPAPALPIPPVPALVASPSNGHPAGGAVPLSPAAAETATPAPVPAELVTPVATEPGDVPWPDYLLPAQPAPQPRSQPRPAGSPRAGLPEARDPLLPVPAPGSSAPLSPGPLSPDPLPAPAVAGWPDLADGCPAGSGWVDRVDGQAGSGLPVSGVPAVAPLSSGSLSSGSLSAGSRSASASSGWADDGAGSSPLAPAPVPVAPLSAPAGSGWGDRVDGSGGTEPGWPGAAPVPMGTVPAETVPAAPLLAPAGSGRPAAPLAAGPSPAALRMLTAQWPTDAQDGAPGVAVQRHRVVSGDDQVEVVLARAPSAGQRGGSAWLARSPYLVWAPLPYDIPEGDGAFACLGTGDEGCLFVDLAAAPGVISLGGDRAAAARLAESIACQLSVAGDAGQRTAVTVVGDAVPGPFPAGVTQVPTVSALGPASAAAGDAAGIVFCEPRSDEETFALARYVATAPRRVVPVVLADLPDAPWSVTVQPSRYPAQPLAH